MIIFDIECYPNLFLIACHNTSSKARYYFEFSNNNWEYEKYKAFCNHLITNKETLVGYNNLFYDDPLLKYFTTYLFNRKITNINLNFLNEVKSKSNNIVQSRDKYPEKGLFKSVDLMKINRFLNISLKQLMFSMRMKNIQELPYKHDSILTSDEIKHVIEYCYNDIDATLRLYELSIDKFKMREELSNEYNKDFTNFDDTKCGEEIFLLELEKSMKMDRSHFSKNQPGELIHFNELIFDYIQFESKEFNKLLEWLKNKSTIQIKNCLNELPFEDLESLEGFYNKCVVKQKQSYLNILYKGEEFVYGVGGIHQSTKGIFESNDDYMILDVDVESMYPSLSIVNQFYPSQFGIEFCNVYSHLKDKRKSYPKTNPLNTAIKLSMNSVYGKSQSEYSKIFSPKYCLTTTLNGQLVLTMLIEKLMNIEGLKVLQSNTDGTTIRFLKSDYDKVIDICNQWELNTRLKLESVEYNKMIIRDVNSYIAQKTDGKVKLKGPFEIDRGLTKDHSMLIVPKAVEQYFIYNKLPEEFVYQHKDIYDFFKVASIKDKQHSLWKGEYVEHKIPYKRNENKFRTTYVFNKIEQCQKVTRYIVSKEGFTLMKEMPPLNGKNEIRYSNEIEGWLVTECNDLSKVSEEELFSKLNYDYYITEIYKLINSIQNEKS